MSEPAAPVQAPPPAALAQNTARYTQQTAPFLPQGFQKVDMPKPVPFQTTRTFVLGKLALAACNFVFAIVALGLSIKICVGWAYNDSIVAGIVMACVAFVSFVWQFADGLTMLIRRSIHRPIHPGAHVGVRLILWIIAILAVGSLAVSVSDVLSYWSVDSDCQTYDPYDDYDGTYYSYCGFDTFASAADARSYMSLLEALLAFSVLLLIGEFTLFVLACVETDRRRKYGKMTKVVYVMAAAPGQMSESGMGAGGVAQPQPAAMSVYA